ncbi:hypothetical protein BVX97_04665 [bacterium E08(2017)]|nr:hypothetical protein BVX97_04665 [bacterium E08(2017)]
MNDELIQQLYNRRRFGIKLGLDVIESMLENLGNPQESYGVVHVAGTNGKGSVSAMLESILHEAGYKTGLYTSPHLRVLNERFRVAKYDIDDDDLYQLIRDIEACADNAEKEIGRSPTFFECTTVMAMECFRRQGVQIAILETGMGGRFDATNVVLPLISVVTRISLEHTEYLGDTMKKIAGEKAGIIKEGRPVVLGAMPEEAESVLVQTAKERKSICRSAQETVSIALKDTDLSGQKVIIESSYTHYGIVKLSLCGLHQLENAATAVAAAEVLQDVGLDISIESIKKGLSSVAWKGRFQVLEQDPPVILDGAHNPDAMAILANSIKKLLAGKDICMVLAVADDKDFRNMLRPLVGVVKKAWVTALSNDRGREPAEVAEAMSEMGIESEVSELTTAISQAKDWAVAEKGAVCIAGSLFLAGDVLEVYNG